MPWVARNGRTVLANDVSKTIRVMCLRPCRRKNTQSELCVPLIFNDDVVGLLDIQSDKIECLHRR